MMELKTSMLVKQKTDSEIFESAAITVAASAVVLMLICVNLVFAVFVSANWPTKEKSPVLPNLAGKAGDEEVNSIMVVTDPIADFLTRIRNANMVYTEKVEIPASKTKMAMANILKDEGFIKDVEYIEDGKQGIIRVYLKYADSKERVITGLKKNFPPRPSGLC